MDIREHDLPGVGKKFAIVTNEGDRMTVIIHNSGVREIYHFKKGEDYPFHAIRLTDSEARKMGAVLGGAYFQPPVAESMDMVMDQLSIEWLKVEEGSPLAGKTRQVRLVHGEPGPAAALAEALRAKGFADVSAPARGEAVEVG